MASASGMAPQRTPIPLVVVQAVGGSSPVAHPNALQRGAPFCPIAWARESGDGRARPRAPRRPHGRGPPTYPLIGHCLAVSLVDVRCSRLATGEGEKEDS